MNGLKTDEQDLLSYVKPDTLWGALAYLVIFFALAMLCRGPCAQRFKLR
jgi:hypothetical protein